MMVEQQQFRRMPKINNDDFINDGDDKLVQLNEDDVKSPRDMDAIMAQEMTKLTLHDRNRVLHQLHGVVDDDPVMDSSLIHEKLRQLRMELDKIINGRNDYNSGNSNQKINSSAFLLAVQQNKEYVYQTTKLCRFLRADDYDVKTTAQRILMHFDKKCELFGRNDVLGREIALRDLNSQDMKALHTGFVQQLPCLDRAGRLIVFIMPSRRGDIEAINLARVLWYMATHDGADRQSPIKGCVAVVYDIGTNHYKRNLKNLAIPKLGNVAKCLPLKNAGIHICYDKPQLKIFISVFLLFIGREKRIRTRLHCGTSLECQYKLMTFGIPQNALPINGIDGSYCPDNHLKWIQNRQQLENYNVIQHQQQQIMIHHKQQEKERSSLSQHQLIPDDDNDINLANNKNQVQQQASIGVLPTRFNPVPTLCAESLVPHANSRIPQSCADDVSTVPSSANASASTTKSINNKIFVPQRHDVLFGKGRVITNHPGNVRFLFLIEAYAERYEAADRFTKTNIAHEILQTIVGEQGRFLRRHLQQSNQISNIIIDNDDDSDWWEQVSMKEARNKVSHAFRTKRAAAVREKRKNNN